MAKQCYICKKKVVFGHTVSHAHNLRPRKFNPNLQRVRIVEKATVKRVRVCTRCIRSGKIRKAS